MGFDLLITISTGIDYDTGIPFVYYNDNGFLEKKPYDPSEFVIPREFRRFIEQRGHHFQTYIKLFAPDCFTSNVKDFLALYPDWFEVAAENDIQEDDDWWTEKDHNEFKRALEWMSNTSLIPIFDISWSY